MAIIIGGGRGFGGPGFGVRRGGCGCFGCLGLIALALFLMSLLGVFAGGVSTVPQDGPAQPTVRTTPSGPPNPFTATPTPRPTVTVTRSGTSAPGTGASSATPAAPTTSPASRAPSSSATSSAPSSNATFDPFPTASQDTGGDWELQTAEPAPSR